MQSPDAGLLAWKLHFKFDRVHYIRAGNGRMRLRSSTQDGELPEKVVELLEERGYQRVPYETENQHKFKHGNIR